MVVLVQVEVGNSRSSLRNHAVQQKRWKQSGKAAELLPRLAATEGIAAVRLG